MNHNIKFGKYLHYKGKEYQLINIAKHSETLEEMAVYYDDKKQLWTRPLEMFLENVEVDGKKIPRFKFVNNA